jgi:hypothetical protein
MQRGMLFRLVLVTLNVYNVQAIFSKPGLQLDIFGLAISPVVGCCVATSLAVVAELLPAVVLHSLDCKSRVEYAKAQIAEMFHPPATRARL